MDSTDYDFYRPISAKIRIAREKADLSQESLASQIGLTRAAVANIEGGRQQILIHILYRIAKACGVDPMILMPSFEELKSAEGKTSADLDEEIKDKLSPGSAQKIIKKLQKF